MNKYALFNENNFTVTVKVTYTKMVEVTTEIREYEVWSYKTLMAKIIVRDTINFYKEVRYYPKSTWYSRTTAKHITKALDAINLHLKSMFRERGAKRVIENKLSFGYAFIRGEGTIEKDFQVIQWGLEIAPQR